MAFLIMCDVPSSIQQDNHQKILNMFRYWIFFFFLPCTITSKATLQLFNKCSTVTAKEKLA